MKECIDIAYSVHDYFGSYYEYLGVSMFSCMSNTKAALRFHVLCDETLKSSAREKLREMCLKSGHSVVFHDMPLDERIPLNKLLKAGYNEGILYRLYLTELLPDVTKIIYLDADILVHDDIVSLWDIDLEGESAAGVWDPPLTGYKQTDEDTAGKCLPFWESTDWQYYINSGVLILDLDKLRKEHSLMDEALDFWDRFGWAYPDQDALNYILRGQIKLLPYHFNVFAVRMTEVRPGIMYHYGYMGGMTDKLNPLDKLYLSYWQKSPFYRSEYDEKDKAHFLRMLKNRADAYLRLKELEPLDAVCTMKLAEALYERGMYAEVCELTSDVIAVSYYRALALYNTGRRDEAIAILEDELASVEDTGYIEQAALVMELRYLAGKLYYEEKRYNEAAAAFTGCLYFGTEAKNELAARALYFLVKCSIRLGDCDAAEEYNNRILVLCPTDERARLNGLRISYGREKG